MTSYSDIAVNGNSLGKKIYGYKSKEHNGVECVVIGNSKLGSLIGIKEVKTSTIMYEDSIIQWFDGLNKIRADKKTQQWKYCDKYDKSNNNKCDCHKMIYHGKQNGKVCNHIVKRCNSVIKTPKPQAKSWNGHNTWQYPTPQPRNSIIEQIETIQKDKGLRWKD